MNPIRSAAMIAALLMLSSTIWSAEEDKSQPSNKTSSQSLQTKAVAEPSKFIYRALLTNEVDSANTDTGTSFLELRVDYRLNPTTSLRFNQTFQQAFQDAERTEASVGDFYFQYAKSRIMGSGINAYLRTTLPTSTASRVQGNLKMELRGEVSGTFLNLGPLMLSAHAQTRYYFADERADGSIQTDEATGLPFFREGRVNREWRLRNYMMGILPVGDWTVLQQAGVQHDINFLGEGGIPQLYLYSEVGYQVTNVFDIAIAAYSTKPMSAARAAMYAKDQGSLYYLNGGLTF